MMLRQKLAILMSKPISWVLLFGCLLRVYAALARGIIGRDGHHYLYQAQAIGVGDWSGLFTCDLLYLSIYPFFIAAANALFGDWIAAGVFINVVFGSATLFPLYFLIRRYADETTSVVTILIYVLIPTFVFSSSDIVRGPMFWFFLSMGMLMFVRQWDESALDKRFRLDLLLSCGFLLLAAWARIEGVVMVGATGFYLLITKTDRKWERLLFFVGPLVCLFVAASAVVLIFQHDVINTFRAGQATNAITEFIQKYSVIDGQLKEIYREQSNWLVRHFFHRMSESLWIMPFAIILHNVIEVIFYPFFIIYVLGWFNIRRRLQDNRHGGYFIWLVIASIGMLYVNMFHTGVMIHRFFTILILPSILIFAQGVDTTLTFFQNRYAWKRVTAIAILVAFFALTGLPKVAKPKEREGVIFRKAAQLIADQKANQQIARVAAAKKSSAYGYVFLYAHRKYAAPLCTSDMFVALPSKKSYSQLVAGLDQSNTRYLLYEERYWPKKQMDFLAAPYQQDFRLMGQWKIDGKHAMMLFERIQG